MPFDSNGPITTKTDNKLTRPDCDQTEHDHYDHTDDSLNAANRPNIQNSVDSNTKNSNHNRPISGLSWQSHGVEYATVSSSEPSSTTSQEAHQPNLPQATTQSTDRKLQTQSDRLPRTNSNAMSLKIGMTRIEPEESKIPQQKTTTVSCPSNTSTQNTINATAEPAAASSPSQPDSNTSPQKQTSERNSDTGTNEENDTTGNEGDDGDHDDCEIAVVLSLDQDELELSPYQCLVRKQIEVFEQPKSNLPDAEIIQGRNRPIVAGQVGIRCRHCGTYPPPIRTKGAILFPSTLLGVYQTAQNMAHTHLIETCRLIPVQIRQELFRVRSKEQGKKTCKSSYGGGRQYWADSIRVLGVVETSEKRLRFSSSARRKLV